ncbi:putative Phospholipase A2 Group IIE protein [Naja naja]|nr:putative Phospholipase A2 Group IIE protein [Naja naja]
MEIFNVRKKKRRTRGKQDVLVFASANLIQFGRIIEHLTGRHAFIYNGYGCYCGWGGSRQPVDATDWCCQAHDCCYQALSVRHCKPKVEKYFYSVGRPNASGKPASVTRQPPSASAARRSRTDTSATRTSCAKVPRRPARAPAPSGRGAEASSSQLGMPGGGHEIAPSLPCLLCASLRIVSSCAIKPQGSELRQRLFSKK